MVYLLNIRALAIRLDRADWAIISRIFLTLVLESLEAKLQPDATHSSEEKAILAQVRENLGGLNDQE